MFKTHSMHTGGKQCMLISIIFVNCEKKDPCDKAKWNCLPKTENNNTSGDTISWEARVMRGNLYDTLTQVLNDSKM